MMPNEEENRSIVEKKFHKELTAAEDMVTFCCHALSRCKDTKTTTISMQTQAYVHQLAYRELRRLRSVALLCRYSQTEHATALMRGAIDGLFAIHFILSGFTPPKLVSPEVANRLAKLPQWPSSGIVDFRCNLHMAQFTLKRRQLHKEVFDEEKELNRRGGRLSYPTPSQYIQNLVQGNCDQIKSEIGEEWAEVVSRTGYSGFKQIKHFAEACGHTNLYRHFQFLSEDVHGSKSLPAKRTDDNILEISICGDPEKIPGILTFCSALVGNSANKLFIAYGRDDLQKDLANFIKTMDPSVIIYS